MAISDTIESMKEHVQAAYSQVETMKGTVPAKKNLENLAGAIGTVKTGTDTSDGTATAADILKDKIAYAKGEKLTGTIETYAGDGTQVLNKLAQYADGTLTEITAEDLAGGTKIIDKAFEDCGALTSVVIPGNVKSIGENAFNICSKLATVIIHEGVISIGISAFQNCTKLTGITIPDSVTSIGRSAFSNSALKSITIPDGVTSIENSLFASCKLLESVIIPDSVTSIGSYAFEYCTKLTSITIPDGVTSIGSYAFQNCTKLTGITIPDGVTKIEDRTFYNCQTLTSVVIPDGVTSIGAEALQIGYSDNKATITMLSTTPPTLYFNSINKSKLNKIIVPVGCAEPYKAATNWSSFADYIEEASE